MDQLHRAADKLHREHVILERMKREYLAPGRPGKMTWTELDLLTAQAKRVRNASTVLVRVAAQGRDELQP